MGKIKFSIIIAVSPERKPEVIESLRNQDYPKEKYEIIIKKGPNTSKNRNSGIREAKGEIIGFVDDDAMVEKDWLRKADEFFGKYPEIDIVGGPQLTPPDDSTFGYVSGIALASIIGGACIRNRYKKGILNLNSDERELTTANVFCKKEVFNKAFFNPDFWPGEDTLFFNELVKKGVKLAYYPELYIYHRRRRNPGELFKQIFRYGYARPAIDSIKKTKRTFFLFVIPSAFFLYLVFSPLLTMWNILYLLPLTFYITIIFAISFTILMKEKSHTKKLLLLPFVFLIIHISYGLGFICGVLKNIKRNSLLRKIELHLKLLLFPSVRKREKNILKKITAGKGLDIGCGCEKVSPNCIGIDITPRGEKGKFGSQKSKISVADYTLSEDNLYIFKDNSFDFIVAKHNLEHYLNPEKTLMEWKRVLKKGGKIGVVVPDDRYVDSIKLDPTHKVSFTLEKLEELFKNAGFNILESGIAIKHWSIYLIAEKPK